MAGIDPFANLINGWIPRHLHFGVRHISIGGISDKQGHYNSHGDHSGGAKYLQDTYSPRLILGAKDWDLLESNTRSPSPRRDIVATDGQKVTLGGTTITLYITPGHTQSTLSVLIPVTDKGKPHLAMEWGRHSD